VRANVGMICSVLVVCGTRANSVYCVDSLERKSSVDETVMIMMIMMTITMVICSRYNKH
jgi:hypothetical protein